MPRPKRNNIPTTKTQSKRKLSRYYPLFLIGLSTGSAIFYYASTQLNTAKQTTDQPVGINTYTQSRQQTHYYAVELARSDTRQSLHELITEIPSSIIYPHFIESTQKNGKDFFRLSIVDIPTLAQAWRIKNKLSKNKLDTKVYKRTINS